MDFKIKWQRSIKDNAVKPKTDVNLNQIGYKESDLISAEVTIHFSALRLVVALSICLYFSCLQFYWNESHPICFILTLPVFQETREGDPVFDREEFCLRHTCGHCTFHPGEERPEQTDDRGVSGKPSETVQQGCVGVSNDVFLSSNPRL